MAPANITAREPHLDHRYSTERRQRNNESIAHLSELLATKLGAEDVRQDGWQAWNRMIAYDTWQLMMLDYSEGHSVALMAQAAPRLFDALERSALPHPEHQTSVYYLAEKDSYSWFLSLFTFAKLLHHDNYLPRLAALLDVANQENRGKDKLYETLFAKMGLSYQPTEDFIEGFNCYPLLMNVIEAEPAKRPQLMRRFLKKWYPDMRGIIWYNAHRQYPRSFCGYWCWEAALVTFLWDIDDNAYRNMPYYPKDLVDWARNPTPVTGQDITDVTDTAPLTAEPSVTQYRPSRPSLLRRLLAKLFPVPYGSTDHNARHIDPIHGISFVEWAASNARLLEKQSLDSILHVLNVDNTQWQQADNTFTRYVRSADPRSSIFATYCKAFTSTALIGRFADSDEIPTIDGPLANFDDYARLAANIDVAVNEAGIDTFVILHEHNMTLNEYAQAAAAWAQIQGRITGSAEYQRQQELLSQYRAAYRKHYHINESNDIPERPIDKDDPDILYIYEILADDWYSLRDERLPAAGWLKSKGGGLDHSWGRLTKGDLTIYMDYDRWSDGALSFAKIDKDAILAELPDDFIKRYAEHIQGATHR